MIFLWQIVDFQVNQPFIWGPRGARCTESSVYPKIFPGEHPVLGDALATLELYLHVRNEEVDAWNWKFIPVEQDEPRVT